MLWLQALVAGGLATHGPGGQGEETVSREPSEGSDVGSCLLGEVASLPFLHPHKRCCASELSTDADSEHASWPSRSLGLEPGWLLQWTGATPWLDEYTTQPLT